VRKLDRADWAWLRTLAGEFAAASKEARGGRVFFDQQWIDKVVVAMCVITGDREKKKSE